MKYLVPFPDDDDDRVNLTPMLDVVFIMLVFFVVTATFLDETGIDVGLQPDVLTLPPDEVPDDIVVRVEPASTFVVNGRVVSRASLVPYVAALLGRNSGAGFAVVTARNSKVRDLAAAADAGRANGFERITIIQSDE